jgi:hypothetical protein
MPNKPINKLATGSFAVVTFWQHCILPVLHLLVGVGPGGPVADGLGKANARERSVKSVRKRRRR